DLPFIRLGVPPDTGLKNREHLAWQFAVNLADYRDSDNEPTIIEWPNQPGRYIFGVEKQPFFTEAYARLIAGTGPSTPGPQPTNLPPTTEDQWFFAFEVFVPPAWKISTDNLYLRAPGIGGTGMVALNTFTQVTSGLPATLLDGGPATPVGPRHGNFYIFCGALEAAPMEIQNDRMFAQRAYVNNALLIPTDGHGRLELVYRPPGAGTDAQIHVLDAIGPHASGGPLANGTASGVGRWAHRVASLSPGSTRSFSLRRSTKGWRFTTGWQAYAEAPFGMTGGPSWGQSLGKPNALLDELNRNVPESVWPTLTPLTGTDSRPRFPVPDGGGRFNLVFGFASGQPFEAFDSVADLRNMLLVGAVNDGSTPAPGLPVLDNAPGIDISATGRLAKILSQTTTGDLPVDTMERVAVGRVDFVDAVDVTFHGERVPWTLRLFELLTTQSHLFDAVDNDGDGLTDLNDPTEAVDVMFRVAGRVNLNTAPATVLRSGPHMSLTPISPEYLHYQPLDDDPAGLFRANPDFFWDFPTAIVAAREDREVALRLPGDINDPLINGAPQQVAVAGRHPFLSHNWVADRGAFAHAAELAALTGNNSQDMLGGQNDLFRVDRLYRKPAPLPYHKVRADEPDLGQTGTASLFSPDYRYRHDNGVMEFV
ncbi:MAG: hypothetical protein GY778_04795, partial [bacterium]|nr:hypothetical protein [bacterium]